MTVKSAIRLLISCAIIWVILSFVWPQIGIARSRMLPAPIAYSGNAKAQTTGYITNKKVEPTSNIFRSTEFDYMITFQYRAPSVPGLWNKPPEGKTTVYTGRVSATEGYYGNVAIGTQVPVKYDPTDPEISGIDQDGAGRNGSGHGFIFGFWIINLLIVLVIGYLLSPWLERLVLRESF